MWQVGDVLYFAPNSVTVIILKVHGDDYSGQSRRGANGTWWTWDQLNGPDDDPLAWVHHPDAERIWAEYVAEQLTNA
jgi:hypothetical protein